MNLRFDLLLEFDRTNRASYNKPKFRAYDTLLTGWYQQHQRYSHLGRPVAVFLCQSQETVKTIAAGADAEMDGRVGISGTPQHEWYYPGRDHIFFAVRSDLHYGSLRCYGLPALPPRIRRDLNGGSALVLRELALLPLSLIDSERTVPAGNDDIGDGA